MRMAAGVRSFHFGILMGSAAVVLTAVSMGCTVGGMAIGSAIDRASSESVDPRGPIGDENSRPSVQLTTDDGRQLEGKCEVVTAADGSRWLLVDRDAHSSVFTSVAERDSVRADRVASLEIRGEPGRYRDGLTFAGAVVDAVILGVIVGGLHGIGD